MNPRAIEITVFKKSSGILSKTIAAAVDGSPVSDGSACRMSSGGAKRVPLPGGAQALGELIGNMASDEALSLGRLVSGAGESAPVTTVSRLRSAPEGTIARSLDFLEFTPDTPAFMLLDIDRKGMPPAVADRVKGGGRRRITSNRAVSGPDERRPRRARVDFSGNFQHSHRPGFRRVGRDAHLCARRRRRRYPAGACRSKRPTLAERLRLASCRGSGPDFGALDRRRIGRFAGAARLRGRAYHRKATCARSRCASSDGNAWDSRRHAPRSPATFCSGMRATRTDPWRGTTPH